MTLVTDGSSLSILFSDVSPQAMVLLAAGTRLVREGGFVSLGLPFVTIRLPLIA